MDVADAVERLIAEFQGRLGPECVSKAVLACRRDLTGAPAQALPELLERLARQRLLDVLPALATAGPQPGAP